MKRREFLRVSLAGAGVLLLSRCGGSSEEATPTDNDGTNGDPPIRSLPSGYFIGTMQLWPHQWDILPDGWKYCDGEILEILSYQTVYTLLGTAFGGDGRTTFALPNLVSPDPNMKYIICIDGSYPPRT